MLVALYRMGDQALIDESGPASLDQAVTGRWGQQCQEWL